MKRKDLVLKGATLIEIIIVITIIAFLVVIFMAFFRNQFFKGNDARRKGDIQRIKVAIEEYEKDNNCYPDPSLVTCEPGGGLNPYLNKIPCDPTTKASYFYEYDTATACARWFRVYANLEVATDPDIEASCGPGGAFNYYDGSSNAPACQLTDTDNFYGCRSGLCVPILWDNSRPGPECDPNYQNPTCYGACNSGSECTSWR
jgi:type II secretory pathway pseudopilin PulG